VTVEDFDAVVLGAGEAGGVVASLAVEAGKRVAMVYRAPYGSTCLNAGCVPSKFMIHRARIAHLARTAARFHVRTGEPSVDLAGIVREKDLLVAEHRDEALQGARAARNPTLVEGAARFVSARAVRAADRTLRADRIFIATGLRPLIPPIEGLGRVRVLTDESLMAPTEPPEHLVVVGGGYVACELGQAFRRYGSRVTLVHGRDHLVPLEEPDVGAPLERAFLAEGIALVLGHRVARAEPTAAGVRVVARSADGDARAIEGTHLLVAAGRRPNTDTLGLAAAGVRVDDRGFVAVDDHLMRHAGTLDELSARPSASSRRSRRGWRARPEDCCAGSRRPTCGGRSSRPRSSVHRSETRPARGRGVDARPARPGRWQRRSEVTDMAQPPRFRCPACGAEFDTREQLEEHGRQHHGAQPGQSTGGGLRCPACGAEFPTQERLEEHARREHARVTS
jgi:uncharacterized C2H2 Zn-finger protein